MLRCLAVVVSQQPTESFAAIHFAGYLADFLARDEDAVVQALVVSFFVIMSAEIADSPAQRSLTEEHHLVQTLALRRADKPLGVRVGERHQLQPMDQVKEQASP